MDGLTITEDEGPWRRAELFSLISPVHKDRAELMVYYLDEISSGVAITLNTKQIDQLIVHLLQLQKEIKDNG